ncbi:MAG: hypothetical protein ACD_7C00144G0003 [uncultured bacterium]|nr:MAG: hypothetical protein ACD_7C00144G0003 [uncultured bacterium]
MNPSVVTDRFKTSRDKQMNKFNKKLNNKKLKVSSRYGFTLVEVIISMGIFVVVMAGSSGVFASAFKSYKGAKNVNENLKNAQFAMNLMSKTFRTSSVVSSSATSIVIFDYSRATRACIRYRFDSNSLKESRYNVIGADSTAKIAACNVVSPATFNTFESVMTSGSVQGSFAATDSAGNDTTGASTRVGKVTVRMKITNNTGGASSEAIIQSTSSLRDYTVANVGIDPNNAP